MADEMQATAYAAPLDIVERHKYVLTLAPNYDYCNAYRKPCPHVARCNPPMFRDPDQEVKTVNLLERLQAMNALNGGAKNDEPTVKTPAITEATAASLVAVPTPGGNPMLPRHDMPAEAPVAINPPPKRGPGRPRKHDTIPAPPPVVEEPAPAPAASNAQGLEFLQAAFAPTPTPIGTDHRLNVLYVGCVPRGVNVPVLETYVAQARAMIGDAAYFAGFGYKTNGLMSESIQRLIQADKPSSLLVIDPRTPEATLCLSYLRSIANNCVESVRQ
jgi:hypothetical protein